MASICNTILYSYTKKIYKKHVMRVEDKRATEKVASYSHKNKNKNKKYVWEMNVKRVIYLCDYLTIVTTSREGAQRVGNCQSSR